MAVPRIAWEQLPVGVRQAVEALTGHVLSASTVGAGQNSAIAAVLETTQGRVFVKGLRMDDRGVVSQQREAAINPHVRAVSAELLWRLGIGGWDLLCFEHVDGRGADYGPGSPDLPRLVATMRRLAELPCPDLSPVIFRRAEERFAAWMSDPASREALTGDTILHTDYNPANVLITGVGEAVIVDWAWPTRGAAWIDPACLIPRLMADGHSVESAEEVAEQCSSWGAADPAALSLFASVLSTIWSEIDRDHPGEPWIEAVAAGARRWQEHRSGLR